MRIEIVIGVTKNRQWVIAPKVETYFHEGQALDRFVMLKRRAELANEKVHQTLGDDYDCRVFQHCYDNNNQRDIELEWKFFSKAYDRLQYPELPYDIPLQRPLFFEQNISIEDISNLLTI